MKNLTMPIRIAIADDHKMICDGLSSLIMTFLGFAIDIIAHDGDELINHLEVATALPHICILDISMPGKNGYDTIHYVRGRWPSIKFLVLTMHNSEHSIVRMFRLGAGGYLVKNCPVQEIVSALHSIHKTGYYHSDYTGFYMREAFRPNSRLPVISEREASFLDYCCTELCYKEIADKMKVSMRTVEGYRDSLFQKLGIKTRIGLAMYAISTGIVLIK